ncbi:outer membrane protein transport protein [Alteromonas sp. 1_MG-2023]|uniref:outer membrane protein transport protein n=1 Tax=Alteromonas sp. 1_MG-2023 TaxID=3062669 RepID=UPI0026E2B20E|nr:outer membrane protein transport protein [Alteromonas sp. 1_MG-2023]MDO6566994.1 outer membrane protein transport protein [Alteromonas sp. 1_MG-2023]
MKQHFSLRASVCLALATMASSSVLAAGFQVNEHSANGFGRAMAGQAATPENASILATNPAAITEFDTAQFSGQISFIDPNIDIRGSMETTVGDATIPQDVNENDIATTALVPSFFYTSPINDKFSWGVGAFTNYGLATDYSEGFNALHFADDAEVTSFTLNPVVAYKVSDTLSLGFGLNITYAEAEIGTSIPQAFGTLLGNEALGNLTVIKMQGDDVGYGYNLGALWKPTETTKLALSYRSETKLNLEGEIESDLGVLIPAVAELYNQDGSLDLDFSAITEIAVDQKVDDKVSLQASIVLTQWSSFDELNAELVSGDDLLLKEEDFEDSLRVSIGGTYLYNDKLTLRAGYAFDEGAVSFEHRSLSIPDTDRQWYTVGATYDVTDNTSVDLAYAYIKGREAQVSQQRAIGSIVSDLTATEHAFANVFSLQVNTSF